MKGDERQKVKGSRTGKDGKILTITTFYHVPGDRRRTVAADGYAGMRPRIKSGQEDEDRSLRRRPVSDRYRCPIPSFRTCLRMATAETANAQRLADHANPCPERIAKTTMQGFVRQAAIQGT